MTERFWAPTTGARPPKRAGEYLGNYCRDVPSPQEGLTKLADLRARAFELIAEDLAAALRLCHDEGSVCTSYETCDHPTCKRNYERWVAADQALRRYHDIMRLEQPPEPLFQDPGDDAYEPLIPRGRWADVPFFVLMACCLAAIAFLVIEASK